MDTLANSVAKQKAAANFGCLLRHWRSERRLSQLTLANKAEISSRHLSFLETGRAQPSREMVQRLANVLDVPLAHQNALLLAAGYAPIYGERELTAPELEHVRRALQFILRQQEPYPAIVIDGLWNVVMQNKASLRIFGLFQTQTEARERPVNAMRAIFHPDGLRRYISNWEELAAPLIQTLHREAANGLHTGTASLRDELLSYPGVPARWSTLDPLAVAPPLLAMKLQKDAMSLAFFSTITSFATPRDITVQQLRIECFHPADTMTEETARKLALARANQD
jgi:transcriptional regulator with XRE-family HTH domain